MNLRKVTALTLVSAMTVTMITGCNKSKQNDDILTPDDMKTAEASAENDAQEQELMDAISNVSSAGSSLAKKQETVYVKANASGGVDSVIVSNWLQNTEGTQTLKDTSDLNDIKNLKGKQTHTVNGIEVEWLTEGEDIYYQGTTDKPLPVDVNITYKLDGNDISPDNLAGKSGHVEIKLDYVNKTANKVMIGDKEEVIYTPFAAVSGMFLDSEKFRNVNVTNGTVVSDGNKNVVIGMAFPGLVDSLNGSKIEDEDILSKIEEKIDIPSEVIVEADVTGFELGMTLTMINSDVMNALGLDDVDLDLDLDDLNDDLDEFSDAGEELVDGTDKLRDGAFELKDGTSDMIEGTQDLYDGVVEYTDGAKEVSDGALKLRDGAMELDLGMTELKEGVDKVDSGAGVLKDGALKISDGVSELASKTKALTTDEGAAETVAKIMTGAGLSDGLSIQDLSDPSKAIAKLTRGILGIDNGHGGYLFDASNPMDSAQAQAAATMMYKLMMGTTQGVGKTMYAGITETQPGADSSLRDGAEKLANGARDLENGTIQLSEGASKIKYGTCSLKDGAQELYDGTLELTEHNDELKDGAKELADGSVDLVDGIEKLYDGTVELNDGMVKFNDEGIKKLTDLFDTDTSSMTDRIKAIVDAGKAYKSFTGTSEDEESSVRFIIESAAIK